MRAWCLYAAIAAVGLVIRFWAYREREGLGTFIHMLDTEYYLGRSVEILTHGLLPDRAFFMSPAYPYFLAAVGATLTSGRLGVLVGLQAVLGIASLIALALGARRIAGSVAATATLALGALAGPLVLYDTSLFPDGPTTALLGLGLGLYVLAYGSQREGRYLGAGVALAIGAALRSNLIAVIPLLALLTAWENRVDRAVGLRRAALLLAPAMIILFGISLANGRAEGVWAPTSYNAGLNLSIGNNETAKGTYSFLVGVHPGDPHGRKVAEASRGQAINTADVDHYWRQRALTFFREHPKDAIALLARKFVLFWIPLEIPQMQDHRLARIESRAVAVARVGFGLLVPLAFVGWIGISTRARRQGLPFLIVIALTLATCVVFFVNGRFRLTAWAGLLPLAGIGIAVIVDDLTRGRWGRSATRLTGAVGIGLILFHIPYPYPKEFTRARSAMRYATVEASKDHPERARAWLRLGTEFGEAFSGAPSFRLERGAARYVLGDDEEAFRDVAAAADAMPDNWRAQRGVLEIGQRLTQTRRAGPEVREAMQRARARLKELR